MTRTLTPDQAVAFLERTIPALQEEGELAMQQAVEATWRKMSELAPRASGRLAGSITGSVRKTPQGVSGTVMPRARYARFVEGGTGEGKTLRGSQGHAYSAITGHVMSSHEELASPFEAMTAYGYGSKTRGKPLALHVRGGVVFRQRVRGQRARLFAAHTRDALAEEVENILAQGAVRATERLLK